MSLFLAPEPFIKSLDIQIQNLKQERQKLAEAQAVACSRGQCGDNDFEAGIVPWQHQIADVDYKISILQSQLEGLKIEPVEQVSTTITNNDLKTNNIISPTTQTQQKQSSNIGKYIVLALGVLYFHG